MSDCSLAVVGLEDGPNSAPRLSTLAARALTGGEAPRLKAGEVWRPEGACALVLAALTGVLVLYEHGLRSGIGGILPSSKDWPLSGGGDGVDASRCGLADGRGGKTVSIASWVVGFALSGESSRSSIGNGSWPLPSQTGILSTG